MFNYVGVAVTIIETVIVTEQTKFGKPLLSVAIFHILFGHIHVQSTNVSVMLYTVYKYVTGIVLF